MLDGRVTHLADLMHRAESSNGSAISSNWVLSTDGTKRVRWRPESAGGGSVSYGSNSNAVGNPSAAGASTLVSRADHVHLGVRSVNGEFGDVDSEDDILVTVTATGSTETVDVSVARTYDLTLTDNCTLTLTGAVNAQAHYLTLLLRQDGTGSRTVTWPASVEWPDDTAPTLSTAANAVDTITLLTVDGGTTWYGYPIGGGSSSSVSGQILIADVHSTPLVFADLIQNEAQDDLVYADP